MKPFDLEAAKRGEPICTRDGREAHFAGTAPAGWKTARPLVAWVEGCTAPIAYPENGGYNPCGMEVGCDLFMAPRKHTAWVNVWIFSEDKTPSSQVFDSKNAAQMNASELRNKGRTVIAEAVPVEWEE